MPDFASLKLLEGTYEQLKRRAAQARESVLSAQERVNLLREVIDDASSATTTAIELSKQIPTDSGIDKLIKEKASKFQADSGRWLTMHMLVAAKSSEEFSREPYLSRLTDACQQPNALRVLVQGAGFNAKVTVEENLNEVAGAIDDWANAVSAVREIEGWGVDKNGKPVDPIKSSQIWRKSIFPDIGAKWSYTIEERLSYSGSIAPFWSLLDRGSLQTMTSDKGGFPYPKQAPTNFVDAARTDIVNEFASYIEGTKHDIAAFSNDLAVLARDLETFRNSVYDDILGIESSVSDYVDDSFKMDFGFTPEPNIPEVEKIYTGIIEDKAAFIERLATKYGKPALAGNQRFINIIETMLEHDGEFINIRITKEHRIEVTESGKERTRVAARKLRRLFQGM